jgi:hypothetical protein
MDVFLSVGTGLNASQELFVSSIEARLRAEGFNPRTVGRNFFSTSTPLKAVGELMDDCQGTIVVALERYFFPAGVERRAGSLEAPLANTKLPTAWNQIEAAMAYCRGHPLMVIVDADLSMSGLLEPGNDWFVHQLSPVPSSLNSLEFNGVLADWKRRISGRAAPPAGRASVKRSTADSKVVDLLGSLRPGELWKTIIVAFGILAAAFTSGLKANDLISAVRSAPSARAQLK